MSSSRIAYLENHVFPRAAADGAFGADAEYVSFRVDDGGGPAAGDQFASDIVFGTVTVRCRTATAAADHRLVIKFKNADPVMSAMMNMNQKFYNEYVFYARLLPELVRRAPDPVAARALFPRFVYSNATLDGGCATTGEQVIVVASLVPDGYRMSDQRLFLDADHLRLALRKLGAFHGLSYAAKAHPDGGRAFVDLTADLAETQWFDGHWYKSPRFLSGKIRKRNRFFFFFKLNDFVLCLLYYRRRTHLLRENWEGALLELG